MHTRRSLDREKRKKGNWAQTAVSTTPRQAQERGSMWSAYVLEISDIRDRGRRVCFSLHRLRSDVTRLMYYSRYPNYAMLGECCIGSGRA